MDHGVNSQTNPQNQRRGTDDSQLTLKDVEVIASMFQIVKEESNNATHKVHDEKHIDSAVDNSSTL
jgi:hypothetical protein